MIVLLRLDLGLDDGVDDGLIVFVLELLLPLGTVELTDVLRV